MQILIEFLFVILLLFFFWSILESRIHQRKSALEFSNEERIKLVFSHNQHTGGNIFNYEEEMITLPMENNKNIPYQGMNANPYHFYE